MKMTAPTTIDQVIDKVRARVASVDPSGRRQVSGVFQLNVRAAGSADKTSSWVGDLQQLTVSEGSTPTPDITVDIDETDFLQIGARTLSLTDALAAGKVHISGNVLLVPTLAEVLLSL